MFRNVTFQVKRETHINTKKKKKFFQNIVCIIDNLPIIYYTLDAFYCTKYFTAWIILFLINLNHLLVYCFENFFYNNNNHYIFRDVIYLIIVKLIRYIP